MSFAEYQTLIAKECAAAPPERLEAFCADVTARMLPYVIEADKCDLDLDERISEIVSTLVSYVLSGNVDWEAVEEMLDELTDILDERSEEGDFIDGDLVEFFDAMDNWGKVHRTQSAGAAAEVSEHMMNILDYHFFDSRNKSETWLSTPRIEQEWNLQQAFLRRTA